MNVASITETAIIQGFVAGFHKSESRLAVLCEELEFVFMPSSASGHRQIIYYDQIVIILNYTVNFTKRCDIVSFPGADPLKTKRQVVSEFRRSEIMNAARAVFARKGFARGIIDEIAKVAGVAKGTVYLYFSSKKEIYRAVLDYDMNFLKHTMLERIDKAGSLQEKIRAFTLARLENSDEKRDFLGIMDTDPGALNFTRTQYLGWLREPVLRIAAAIEDASRRGEIRDVPAERAAWAIADLVRGSIQRRLSTGAKTTVEEEADFLVDFVSTALNKK
jgi:AcrR family transcriptional regulator